MTTTKKGFLLAHRLWPAFADTGPSLRDIALPCSRICKLSATMQRIAEDVCSREMPEREARRLADQDTRCEELVAKHCITLTKMTGVDVKPLFQGDPRGVVVKLTLPPKWQYLYDCHGNQGVCVP